MVSQTQHLDLQLALALKGKKGQWPGLRSAFSTACLVTVALWRGNRGREQ